MRYTSHLASAVLLAAAPAFAQTAPAQERALPPITPTHPAPACKVIDAQGVAGIYDVRAFGAAGDGKTLDSPAINKAIETAAANGGGTVRLPAGTYLSYSIRLKSNITLYIDSGAKILAANRAIHGGDGYDAPEDIGDVARYQDFGHSHWHNSLIWGENLDHVTITGPGIIDGGLYDADGNNNPAPAAGGRQGTMGVNNGLGGGGGGGARGGRGGRGAGAAATAPGTTDAAAPDAATAPALGRGGARGGRGGGDPFAGALAALQNPPGAEPATQAAAGRGGRGGRPNTRFTTDLSRPFRDAGGQAPGAGNKSIALKLCKNVTLSNFSVLRGGHFALLATGIDNFTIDNLKIDTNRDGFDIDGCRNVRVSNCAINSPADDGICLKSSWGLGFARACENITITNCLVAGGWEVGSMLDGTYAERNPGTGRIKFGTESNGGFKNITISNCVFDRCQGLALEAVDGAIIDNVSISNITMREIGSLPIFIRLGDRRRMPAVDAAKPTAIGAIRHVSISDIVAQNRAAQYACEITGIPGHDIEDVHISNVRMIWPGGAPAGIEKVVPPENEFMYPEPGMFGVIPASAFFIRHVKGISLNNIESTTLKPDMRPPFWLFDVHDADFFNIRAPHEQGVPMFMLKNVTNFRTHEVRGVPDTTKETVDTGTL
jgi:polygalacturonase